MARQRKSKIYVLSIAFLLFLISSAYAEISGEIWDNQPVEITNKKEKLQLVFSGYGQFDAMIFDGAPQLQGQTNIRSAELILNGDYKGVVDFNIDYAIAQKFLKFLFITFNSPGNFSLSFGQISGLFGLENNDNTPALTFFEESLATNLFAPPYGIGVMAQFNTKTSAFVGSVYGTKWGTTYQGRTPFTYTFEYAYSPIHTKKSVIQVDVSWWLQKIDSGYNVGFNTIPEIMAQNTEVLIDTGTIENVRSYQVADSGFIYLRGPFSIQGEYINTWVARTMGNPQLQFSGYYIDASYFLTGESRNYSFQFLGFTTLDEINGKYGAWQLALRYSELNLNSHDVLGGREHNISVGLNWFPTKYLSVMLNYIRAIANPNVAGVNQSANFYGLRLQGVF